MMNINYKDMFFYATTRYFIEACDREILEFFDNSMPLDRQEWVYELLKARFE